MSVTTPIFELPAATAQDLEFMNRGIRQYASSNSVADDSPVVALRDCLKSGRDILRGCFTTKQMTREEYLNLRKWGIGASDISVIMGLNPWKDIRELFEERVTGKKEFKGNARTRWGTAAEDFVAQVFGKECNARIVRPGVMHSLRIGGDRYINATLDFIALDGADKMSILECKAPASDEHWQKIPVYYWLQIQQQMMVSGIHQSSLSAFFFPGHKIIEDLNIDEASIQRYFNDPVFRDMLYMAGKAKHFYVKPHFEVMSEIVRRSLLFLDMVDHGKLDVKVFEKYRLEDEDIEPIEKEPIVVQLSDEDYEKVRQAASFKKQIDDLNKSYEAIRAELLSGALAGPLNSKVPVLGVVGDDRVPVVKKQFVESVRLDAARLKEAIKKENPDFPLKKFEVPSRSERMNVL